MPRCQDLLLRKKEPGDGIGNVISGSDYSD